MLEALLLINALLLGLLIVQQWQQGLGDDGGEPPTLNTRNDQ